MGPYLSQPISTKSTIVEYNKEIRFVSTQMQGWRKNMQDSKIHKINLPGGISIFGVFDGHGGYQVSKYLERYFIKEILANQNFQRQEYQKALQQTFKKLDCALDSKQGNEQLKNIRRQIQKQKAQIYQDQHLSNGIGSTANVLIITPTKYYSANAGDSRSVLSRNGISIALSDDHKPENQIQKKRIQTAGGTISNGRVNGGLNLSRSFGDFYYKRQKGFELDEQPIISKPDIRVQQRSKQDQFIIMGCDGIWQRYGQDNQGMIDKIINERRSGKDSKRVLQQLLDSLIAKSTSQIIGCDNMTAILIQFNKAG